jgi:hypothetical protein
MITAQWLEDFRWAMLMKRVRCTRRRLLFSQRQKFDDALRPRVAGDPGTVLAYPDAIYHIDADDLQRALRVTMWSRP